MHTITAFANDINNWGGGYIVIGIEETHGKISQITGIVNSVYHKSYEIREPKELKLTEGRSTGYSKNKKIVKR